MEFPAANDDIIESATVVKALGKASVLQVSPEVDGTFMLTEACDFYYYIILTRDQLHLLGQELIALASQEST